MKVEIYSDVACPWCYIGQRRFQRALAALPLGNRVEVVYRSYQLDPTMPHDPVPMNEYLQRRFGARSEGMQQQVAEAARGEGIEIDFAGGVIVNTLTAHRLLRLAEQEYGVAVQRGLTEKLFEAHFERGQDISNHGVLSDLAAAVGTDVARVRDYLGSGEGLKETRAAIEAASALGVRAVPTFVFDGQHALEGAQPTSTFLQVIEQLDAAATKSGSGSEGDAYCVDGACSV